MTTRRRGGLLDPQGVLMGVGYSDNANANAQVLSGEWTYGAIMAVRALLLYHERSGCSTVNVSVLQADLESMSSYVEMLSSDNYGSAYSQFPGGVSPRFYDSLPSEQLAIVYASKRYYIPLGWYGNPLPCAASTSWAIFTRFDFNPFCVDGKTLNYYPTATTPASYDRNATTILHPRNIMTVYRDDSTPVLQIYVEVKLSNDSVVTVIPAASPLTSGRFQEIVIPDGATTLLFYVRYYSTAATNAWGASTPKAFGTDIDSRYIAVNASENPLNKQPFCLC